MQEPIKPISFTPPAEYAHKQHSSAASFLLHLPETGRKLLPVSPKTIARMVAAWLVLLVVLSMVVTNVADKPQLSEATPVKAGKMHAELSVDDERRANIDSLAIYLEKYSEAFAAYPSVSQINSIEFRKADPAFKLANPRTYVDPSGNTSQLVGQPTKNAYYYVPTPLNCDNSKVQCVGYTIGATLGDGSLYSKHNEQ